MNQNNTKIKYFLYARKSSESEDRQMASIDSQVKELNKIGKENGFKVIKIFSEAKSAKAPGREKYNEMISEIKKGKANGIICWKLNRLARNPIDGGEISWLLQQGIIQHIYTFGRSYYTGDNVLMMAVELGMANQFINDLRTDTTRGLKNKAERGWYPVYAPLGYMHNPVKRKGDKEIIKDMERFDLVQEMWKEMVTGKYSAAEIIRTAINERGLTGRRNNKITRGLIYKMFSNPFYYGEFEFPKKSGKWYKGKHEPMITKSEFDKVQFFLGRKNNPRPIKYNFPFTGLIRCSECGCMITAEQKIKRQKNGNVHYYIYYRCTKKGAKKCRQKAVRSEELEGQIKEILDQIQIPNDFVKWALNIMKRENKEESRNRSENLQNLRADYDKCTKRVDNLIDMRADGEIDENEFKNRKVEMIKEKNRLQGLLDQINQDVDDWIERAEKLFDFASFAKERFVEATDQGNDEIKKDILASLGSHLYLKDQKLIADIKEPLIYVKNMSQEINSIFNRLEPLKKTINKEESAKIYAQSLTLYR